MSVKSYKFREAKSGEAFDGTNFVILPMTFKEHGKQIADLYKDKSSNRIEAVGSNHCPTMGYERLGKVLVDVTKCYHCICRERQWGTSEDQKECFPEKSKACSKVLQGMDAVEDPNYSEIVSQVVSDTGVSRKELEKELDRYI
eukprot:TRINITY_DN179610_c1_g2_i1.p1 TRINITY_DN179610_c1_g2~~TRINITY_DN179610_c1_g2_i1.p1  ORF type:complete len:143 (-),score=23.92 TRINITY_DN179610_c1_g2_i1:73-501(-)